MAYQSNKLSNFFIPKFPSRPQMKKFNESELIISKEAKDGDVEMKDEVLPTGIIDAWKLTKSINYF